MTEAPKNTNQENWPMSIPDMLAQGYTHEWVALSFRISIRLQANRKRQEAAAQRGNPLTLWYVDEASEWSAK